MGRVKPVGRWKERGGVMVGKDGGLRFNKVVLMLEKGRVNVGKGGLCKDGENEGGVKVVGVGVEVFLVHLIV